jgi:hypothetical protein
MLLITSMPTPYYTCDLQTSERPFLPKLDHGSLNNVSKVLLTPPAAHVCPCLLSHPQWMSNPNLAPLVAEMAKVALQQQMSRQQQQQQ